MDLLGCCVEQSSAYWMLFVLTAFTVFTLTFFFVACVACRWIYKRRMLKKCAALRQKYLEQERLKKSEDIKFKKMALRPILPYHLKEEDKETLNKLFLKSKLVEKINQSPVNYARALEADLSRKPAGTVNKSEKSEKKKDEKESGKNNSNKQTIQKHEMKHTKKEGEGSKKSKVGLNEKSGTNDNKVKKELVKNGKMLVKQKTNRKDMNELRNKSDRDPLKTSSAFATLRQLNAYELKELARQKQSLNIEDKQSIQEASMDKRPYRDELVSNQQTPRMGFNFLRDIAKKSLKECFQSNSYPEMPSRTGE